MTQFERITQEAGVMGGKACIRGLRVTVATIVGQIGAGHTIEEILADLPGARRHHASTSLGRLTKNAGTKDWRLDDSAIHGSGRISHMEIPPLNRQPFVFK
jgi:hypothetical protein